jgi:large subunit ribosomal protein L25
MELAVHAREKFGKAVKLLRGQGLIPAELYGHGFPNAHLAVPAKDFRKAYKEAGESTIITLIVAGKKHPALIYNVQRDSVSDEVVHVDFYQVRMDEKIKTHVPLEFLGEAPAVKEHGGILNKSVAEIEVEALPGDLPHTLKIDLSKLTALNQSLYVKDIVVPKGVKFLIDPGTAVATVTEKMAEEVVAPVAVDVAEVKVETEEKKAERDKEKVEKEGPTSAPSSNK